MQLHTWKQRAQTIPESQTHKALQHKDMFMSTQGGCNLAGGKKGANKYERDGKRRRVNTIIVQKQVWGGGGGCLAWYHEVDGHSTS